MQSLSQVPNDIDVTLWCLQSADGCRFGLPTLVGRKTRTHCWILEAGRWGRLRCHAPEIQVGGVIRTLLNIYFAGVGAAVRLECTGVVVAHYCLDNAVK